MRTLVFGATGATGKLLVRQLLERGVYVRIVVRSTVKIPLDILGHANLIIIRANVQDASDQELAKYVNGCDAVVSCLGHHMNLKGIFGSPRRLVTNATRRLCHAIHANKLEQPVKFVLMNTTGNRNRDLDEQISFVQKLVVGSLRFLLPPYADNEDAADYLRTQIGQVDEAIQWAVVRPDALTSEAESSEFEVHPSPTRSAIFDAGKTSRINVACFMAELVCDDDIWSSWKGRMPVIYNKETDVEALSEQRCGCTRTSSAER